MKLFGNFKVGDRIKIRSWEDMEKEYGDPEDCPGFFTKGMRHLCGRTATITEIGTTMCSGYPSISLDFDDKSGDTIWGFTTAMIEPLYVFNPREISW